MTNTKENKKLDYVKAFAWLLEAAFRGFVAYLLLVDRSNYIVIAAGVYAAVTALIIVGKHFITAHQSK